MWNTKSDAISYQISVYTDIESEKSTMYGGISYESLTLGCQEQFLPLIWYNIVYNDVGCYDIIAYIV